MAVNSTGSEDAWQRQALIEVTDGTSSMNLHAITETIDIDMGERDLDKVDLLNLGQIPKHGAIGITSITFEGYPTQAGSAAAGDAGGFFDIFASKPVIDASQALDIDISNTLTRYRVAVLWTNDTDVTGAEDDVDSGDAGIRFVMAECFCTSCKTSFTDGMLKQTLVFKGLAFDKSAAANIKMESTTVGAAAAITALGAYTAGTTKWA